MREKLSRRRFVEAAGAASVFALAGCTDGGNDGGGAEGGNGSGGNESGNESNETNESGSLGDEDNESGNESEEPGNETENETGGENDDSENETGNETGNAQTQAIRLGAETAGWKGQAPSDIEDETNPTISLQAGTSYDLTWENLDGEEHELIVADADETEIQSSGESEQEGETVSMTVNVTQEMAGQSGIYYCEYHPEAMRGEFSVE